MLNTAFCIKNIAKIENFQKFYDKAQKRRGKYFTAYFSLNKSDLIEESPSIRIAVVASKKGVDKRATRRNTAKRRFRIGLRNAIATFALDNNNPPLPSFDWVVSAQRGSVSITLEELQKELYQSLVHFLLCSSQNKN